MNKTYNENKIILLFSLPYRQHRSERIRNTAKRSYACVFTLFFFPRKKSCRLLFFLCVCFLDSFFCCVLYSERLFLVADESERRSRYVYVTLQHMVDCDYELKVVEEELKVCGGKEAFQNR